MSIGVSGGQVSHVAAAMLQQASGADFLIIPYKGNAQVNTDLMGGQVKMSFGSAGNSLPGIRSGKLKAIGVGGREPLPALPGVAPIARVLPGFEAVNWVSLFAPEVPHKRSWIVCAKKHSPR